MTKFNVDLRVDDSPLGSQPLPYVGEFTVSDDGRLVRGLTKGLDTHKGLVDMASEHPLHVDFDTRAGAYLVRKGSEYYLKDTPLEITSKVVSATVRAARRYRT